MLYKLFYQRFLVFCVFTVINAYYAAGQVVRIENIESIDVVDKSQRIFDSFFDTECSDVSFNFSTTLREESLEIFNNGNSSFPFERGVVVSTGIATGIVGPNDQLDTSTGFDEFGNYFPIIELLDHRIGNMVQYPEAKVINLNVTSSTNQLRLRYMFASEAYQNGNIECFNGANEFQDGFAIILRGPGIVPDTYDHDNDVLTPEIEFSYTGKNIALLPDGMTEVGLHSVHQNTTCSNAPFHSFYQEIPLGTGAISANGITVPLVAESTIVPGETYEIEIILANRGDSRLDSYLFFEFPENPMIPDLEEEYILCLNENGQATNSQTIIDTRIEDNEYSFKWFFQDNEISEETNSSIMPEIPGEYSVEVIGPSGCSSLYSTNVVGSSAPFDVKYELAGNLFSNNQDLNIFVDGIGEYLFQINDSSEQVNPRFTNIGPGKYDVVVTDIRGCGFVEITIVVVDYPNFFTPNNDGYNDTWNIPVSDYGRSGKIEIYDRYGKLIAVIDSEADGWDGSLNGIQLPASDYWFNMVFDNNFILKGHFSLVR